jgi:hypothetical protein
MRTPRTTHSLLNSHMRATHTHTHTLSLSHIPCNVGAARIKLAALEAKEGQAAAAFETQQSMESKFNMAVTRYVVCVVVCEGE